MHLQQKRDWALPALWLLLTCFLSTSLFSFVTTGRLIEPLVHFFWPKAGWEAMEWINLCLRKLAHMSIYAGSCSILLYTLKDESLRARIALFALACALLDEGHQLFEYGREGSLRDVNWDWAGALLALYLYPKLASLFRLSRDPSSHPKRVG